MSKCQRHDPDKVFQRFKVIEFTISLVGLSRVQLLDVEINLKTSAYLKTLCEGRLIKFEEAHEISENHRAFNLELINEHTLLLTFCPTTECINRAKRRQQEHNRFVFDLHLIKVEGARCCNDEKHSEIGRYYLSGQYDYCQVTHKPKIVDFGEVFMNNRAIINVNLRNGSKLTGVTVEYVRLSAFDVKPASFVLPPNSVKRLTISIRPNSLKQPSNLLFKIRNCSDNQETIDVPDVDENYITYLIATKISVSYNKKPKIIEIESLHKLYDPLPKYTYLNEELEIHKDRRAVAFKQLEIAKCTNILAKTLKSKEEFITGNIQCYSKLHQCKSAVHEVSRVTPFDLFDIEFLPNVIDFRKVTLSTYGQKEIVIKNKTNCTATVHLCPDARVLYTKNKLTNKLLVLQPLSQCKILISCTGLIEGSFEGSFEYTIDGKYNLKHMYIMEVCTPSLLVRDRTLKLGMVSADSFVTSVPIRIYNEYNTTGYFQWGAINSEIPFEVLPKSGSIPGQSCKICDVWYMIKPTTTKTKSYEIEFISYDDNTSVVTPIELSIVTRKLSIKFLQPTVIFKEILLNTETIEKVKLENSSRELVTFQVMEPLIPGLWIEPMQGIINPKNVMNFNIIVKISCILEFAFDVCLKINNKEVICLPISGVVAEPKINIQPKNIYLPRIPCEMVAFVPVTFQNLTTLITEVEIVDTSDPNIFDVYGAQGQDKQRISNFFIQGGESKTVFIKVYDTYRREYEMYIPFRINKLWGPPTDTDPRSTEASFYMREYGKLYEGNPKVKLKTLNRDIPFCRISGVITVPWLLISEENFNFDYNHNCNNALQFSITNVSKYTLIVTIMTSKLAPTFSLKFISKCTAVVDVNETSIKFVLIEGQEVELSAEFNPKHQGTYVATALTYLDKTAAIPYSNLTFYGKRMTPGMAPSAYRVIFPPFYVGTGAKKIIQIDYEAESDLEAFNCDIEDKKYISYQFLNHEIKKENNEVHTIVYVELSVTSDHSINGRLKVNFSHTSESVCDIQVYFCATYCPLTLHANKFLEPEENPYPYYPLSTQTEFYEYMESCRTFLEKWMFMQGFRRDLCPIIPDTFHALSSTITTTKPGKGINVSYMNFVKKIAGPLMKYVKKEIANEIEDETFRGVKEVYDTYKGIINLLQSRNANILALQPKFLLSYDQFVIYEEYVTPSSNAEIVLSKKLLADVDLFNRLNKQSWMDFILQSYKVFVMDTCFFECVCVSNQARDIIKILIDWYNEQILKQHNTLRPKDTPVRVVTNITTDLRDGIALASTILTYCPFLQQHFSIFSEITEENEEGDIINNACLVVEAMNQLRLFFPLCSKDFFEPSFLQMLFLSIHLYVVLPMFTPKDKILLNPPLLRCSNRNVAISPSSQESLTVSYIILNNNRNSFTVEKGTSPNNGKKLFVNIKYTANFVQHEQCLLLVHGYNKTRIFDTYITFKLIGQISAVVPERKCKVTGPLYRPSKVDVIISSPFPTSATFRMHITDVEPTMPVNFDLESKDPRFFLQRLNLFDKEILINGAPKDSPQDCGDQKLFLLLICLSTQVGNSWIWFRSEIGEFFIKVTTQPRWDLSIDTLNANVYTWPMDPCSCGEACECYRTSVVSVPHRNDLMLKALRAALSEHASPAMMDIYDRLIDTVTGKLIIAMLLEEGGTDMSELYHLLRSHTTYRIHSRSLIPRLTQASLNIHSNTLLTLPITIPVLNKADKYTLTLTSECAMDIRTYRIIFIDTTTKESGTNVASSKTFSNSKKSVTYGSKKSVIYDSKKSVIHDSKKSVIRDSKKSIIHDSKKSVINDSKKSVIHDSKKSVIHDSKKSVIRDSKK